MRKSKQKTISKQENLEKSLRIRGKLKTVYEKCDNEEFKSSIEEKIKFIWNYIMNIDDIVTDEDLLKEGMNTNIGKKKGTKKIDEFDEILYYNRNLNNLINVQKIRKTLHHFKINVNLEDIIRMFLCYTNNEYFQKNMRKDMYTKNYIERKKVEKNFQTLNINNLYLDYNMFKHIFMNIDLNIEPNGQIW